MKIRLLRHLSRPFVWTILAALTLQCWPAHAADSLLIASPRDQAADERIRAALGETISCDFRDRPLSQFAQALGQRLGISVILDVRGLNDANPRITPDTLITIERQDASAESVLAALKQWNMQWIVSDEALVLTSSDEADKHLVLKIYPVRDLLDMDTSDGSYDCDPLIQLIQDVVVTIPQSLYQGQ
jgi:hypothetical protein